jgi:hypothetical protein
VHRHEQVRGARHRVENEVDFWNLEARDFDVEADSDEMLQLDSSKCQSPTPLECGLAP